MKHFLKTLQDTLAGDISIKNTDLEYYSTDGGVFELTPTAIVFPADAQDVSKLVKTVNQLNQNGSDFISLTARGNGTDQGGGPINTGIVVDFMKHMNHILEIGEDFVLVQPGCLYGRVEKEIKERGRFLPSYPASVEISTIGGAVANNAAGEKTVKYGATRDYVEAVQVVLADGTLTWLHNTDGAQLEKNKQREGSIGSIYTQMDELISSNHELIHSHHPETTKESSGYALWRGKESAQSLNLAQIVTGSQGTLCFVTAIRLRTIPMPAQEHVVLTVSYYDNMEHAGQAAERLHNLKPSALEIVDRNLLELVKKHKPELLGDILPKTMPEIVLLAEFDDENEDVRNSKLDQAKQITDELAYEYVVKKRAEEQADLWKLRRSAAAVMWTIPGTKKALPIIEDGTVPPSRLIDFLHRAYEIFKKYDLEIAVWGHAGDADLHMQPFMDLGKESDRKKIFKMTDEFYAMVHELGGTAAGEHNDSLMRAPYRKMMFGEEMEELFNKTKAIFDPENLFNPHKKVGVDFKYVKKHLRHEYSIKSIGHLEQEQAQKAIDR